MKVNWQKTTEKYKGRSCVGGIDLSSVSDLTCWVMAFPDKDEPKKIDILMRAWCPEAKIYDKKNKYRDQYQGWKAQGFLETTEGNAIDYDFVRHQIVADAKMFNIWGIAIDIMFDAHDFMRQLNIEMGRSKAKPAVFGCGAGPKYMGPPCNELERRLLEKQVNHGGNPLLRFMADNVAVKSNPAGMYYPDKASSQGKIDGIVGLLLCIDRLIRQEPPSPPPRVPIFV
ncbi:MAG TPA: hypothetical protein ENI07_23785 [Desulfobacterales bacterium]|nr:hypothetical protein [Desulfobacterales bacterium]